MSKIRIGFESSLYIDNTTNVIIRDIKGDKCLIGKVVKARGSMYFESKELEIGKIMLHTDKLTMAKKTVIDLLKEQFSVNHIRREKIIQIYKGELSHEKENPVVQKINKEWHNMPAC